MLITFNNILQISLVQYFKGKQNIFFSRQKQNISWLRLHDYIKGTANVLIKIIHVEDTKKVKFFIFSKNQQMMIYSWEGIRKGIIHNSACQNIVGVFILQLQPTHTWSLALTWVKSKNFSRSYLKKHDIDIYSNHQPQYI